MTTKQPTELQSVLIKKIIELTTFTELLEEQNKKEDSETDAKLVAYQKSIGKERDYTPDEKEREENIGPVMHSENRIKRDEQIKKNMDLVKKNFLEITDSKLDDETNYKQSARYIYNECKKAFNKESTRKTCNQLFN